MLIVMAAFIAVDRPHRLPLLNQLNPTSFALLSCVMLSRMVYALNRSADALTSAAICSTLQMVVVALEVLYKLVIQIIEQRANAAASGTDRCRCGLGMLWDVDDDVGVQSAREGAQQVLKGPRRSAADDAVAAPPEEEEVPFDDMSRIHPGRNFFCGGESDMTRRRRRYLLAIMQVVSRTIANKGPPSALERQARLALLLQGATEFDPDYDRDPMRHVWVRR